MDIGALQPGKADPYCKVYLSNDPGNKYQTKVCVKTLEPVWNEKSEFHVSMKEEDIQD